MSNTSIVVCGQKFDIGKRVVLWDEPNGFNAYSRAPYYTWQTNRATGKKTKVCRSKGKRYKSRTLIKKPTLAKLQNIVHQWFLHHSGLYRARDTFNVLHNERGISVHFILDDNGVLYQTLDLRERAWHGGCCNKMSVGIEIDSRANARKYPYAYDLAHQRRHGVGPRRVVEDTIHGHRFLGFDYSDAQYDTLVRLTRVILKVFPKIKPEFPRNSNGIIKDVLSKPQLHHGFICHLHADKDKWDPVSFDYSRFLAALSANRDIWVPPVQPEANPTQYNLATVFGRQQALAFLGYDPGPIDGRTGPRTEAATRRFQREHGLVVDGKWGPKTTEAMRKNLRG